MSLSYVITESVFMAKASDIVFCRVVYPAGQVWNVSSV